MDRFSLELTGELLRDANPEQAAAALAKLLRLAPDQAAALLRGQPRRVGGVLPGERAQKIRHYLEQAGIGCRLEPAALATTSATAAFSRPSNFGVERPSIQCPKCGQSQPPGDICQHCGIVFDKYQAAERRRERAASAPPRPAAETERLPYRLLTQLALLLFLSSLAVALWSHWRKDQFPPPDFYDLTRLEEPRQTPTALEPFAVEAEDIRYRIEPLFDYELNGVVVSLHDSDAFIDVYHFKDWKDFLNIRDLCVVWGENVASGAFRDMHYKNSTWTCWISTRDPIAADRFHWQQLSNNHVLAHEPHLYQAIKSAEIGDQINFSGQLARYSHDGGFSRGTSISRTDTGNGACETIYIRDFRIVKKSNPGWRLTYRLSTGLTWIALIAFTVLFFISPYRPHR
ncbi:hypothetical protein [Thiorhodovibrio frisius]|uniref:Uncharacterized protein n=1 Tax=Thiorhodovibrio frisius TaxID=631362 RepID=H8Z542_9GAMM|nr:hypothetical protein [Thiorhodovibrio frisius]EIC20449.1 hypothetical protein Thi970DRAFT_04086 [Thiorhodovibrio frisius]WPL21193.1 hypothetical protein Thiofri_01304 [Thiorhodovibrio frisius]